MTSRLSFVARLLAHVRATTYPTPTVCLCRLARMHPRYIAQIDAVRWAQQCLDQARKVIGRRSCYGIVGPGDEQAIDLYENAVAAGFYRMERESIPAPTQPVAGSDWSETQLLRMRCMRFEHGRLIRKDTFAQDTPLAMDATPPPW